MSHDENAFRTQSLHVSQKGSLANLFENSNKAPRLTSRCSADPPNWQANAKPKFHRLRGDPLFPSSLPFLPVRLACGFQIPSHPATEASASNLRL